MRGLWYTALVLPFMLFLPFAVAFQNPLPYALEPVTPEKVDLSVKGTANVDLFTGAAIYRYSLEVPPGTHGLAPSVEFVYNSQNARGLSVLGAGWQMSDNYIQRDTNGSFTNASDDTFKLVLDGASYDLVYFPTEGRFHTTTETFIQITNLSTATNLMGQYWLVRATDGTAYRFGFYPFSEAVSNQHSYVWRWSLDTINDTYGNSIFYNYSETPYVSDNSSVYLDKISYNNDLQRVILFDYETTDRPDRRMLYLEGNKIIQSRRLNKVSIYAQGSLVRRYEFSYSDSGSIANSTSLTFIKNITEVGSDNQTALPSTTFEYISVQAGWNNGSSMSPPECIISEGSGSKGILFADVNNDGFTDLLRGTESGSNCLGSEKDTWLGNGTGWTQNTTWETPSCFSASNGRDLGLRFIDANKDGLIDILRAREVSSNCGSSERDAWINNGSGWSLNTSFLSPTCFVNNEGVDLGVRMEDVNNDGLVDMVRGREFAGNCGNSEEDVWLHNGSGWTLSAEWKLPTCFITAGASDRGVRFADVNGDGLPDLLRGAAVSNLTCSDSEKEAWINNGSGWYNDDGWEPPTCFVSPGDLGEPEDQGLRLVDVNNDGLVDMVHGNTTESSGNCDESQKNAWINNGSGWQQNNAWRPPRCFVNQDGYDRGLRLIETGGDGTIDYVWGKETTGAICNYPSEKLAYRHNSSKELLLTNITTEFGGVILIDYISSIAVNNTGNDSISDLGFPMWLVSNITYDNRVSGPHALRSVRSYEYLQGKFDYPDKEFRGFGQVIERVENNKIKHLFHQNDGFEGKEYSIEYLNESNGALKTIQRKWVDLSSTSGYHITHITETSEITFDGDSADPKMKNTTYGYDSLGNIVYIHNRGDIHNPNDDSFEYFEYSNNTNAWIVSSVKNYTLLGANNATVSKYSLYAYDGLAYGQTPLRGSVTRLEEFLDTSSNPVMNYSYNSYGNKVNETDSQGRRTEYIYGINDTTNTFSDAIINPAGHRTNYTYFLGFGKILIETDQNGFRKVYGYDLFGRILNETEPLDDASTPTRLYVYNLTSTPSVVTIKKREINTSSGTLDEQQFFDGFGSYIQTKKESTQGRQIVVDIFYDSAQRITNQSNPYFVGATDSYTTPNSSIALTKYRYDPLNRVVQVTNPDATNRTITYDHWNITIADEKGNAKTYSTDAFGRIVLVIEYLAGSQYYTRYNYSASDALVKIQDDNDNGFSYTYDTLNRKIRFSGPDTGSWNYSYDSVGNLVEQNDSRSKRIALQYDNLNRKVSENASRLVTYGYDTVIKGVLSNVSIENTTINYTYDSRLRTVEKNSLFLSDNRAYPVRSMYDSLDRITSRTLPDGRIITYVYDAQGNIASINTSFASARINFSYNEKGDIASVIYGNALITNYTYNESTFRLAQIITGTLQELHYFYDGVGNVQGINDSAHGLNTSMTYDEGDRLTNVTIFSSTTHFISFTYNELGNLLNVTVVGGLTRNAGYEYQNTSLAHAPSRVTYY